MDNSSFNNPSKIIGIQFSVFSPEEIEKYSVVEVSNKETYVERNPRLVVCLIQEWVFPSPV